MEDINIQISDLESQIASLPVGYISKKMINGKERYYQQWTENGKIKSKYIKNEEVEEFQKKIEFRKSLQSKLSELKSSAAFIETPSIKDAKFNLRIIYGTDLKDFASQTKNFQKRDCFTQIQEYLYSDTLDKVENCTRNLADLMVVYAKPFVQTLFSKNNELSSHRFCLQSVCYQTCFVNFIRSFVAQPLMNPFTIEELYKFPETFSQFLCT